MPVTLNANALTTLAEVLDELDLLPDGSRQDRLLTRYINAASAFVAAECGRAFERADDLEESAKGYGLTKIAVARTPILDVASITIDGDELDASDYEIDDARAGFILRSTGWPWTAGVEGTGISGRQVPGSETADIVVTYDGGYVTGPQAAVGGAFAGEAVTLPSDLEDAVIELVVSRYMRRGQDLRIRARGFEASAVTFGGEPVPPEIMAVLDKHRRIPNA